MKLARVVTRLPIEDRKALDRLRARYFEETEQGISRAAVIRVLVHRGLAGVDACKATEVLREPEVTAASVRATTPPQARRGAKGDVTP